ncbi:MAG TPA: S49 family peptidase [Ideonella sp.]|uniref:S49 family peptidase n=1 Tax=Ideonella sp. TaxID=1929293 RepID=UPI002E2F2EA8|nr:S49 family peptidase [Ideonella sp.]HEX5685242.1 S49 family peptidase [Ideonella sp.]
MSLPDDPAQTPAPPPAPESAAPAPAVVAPPPPAPAPAPVPEAPASQLAGMEVLLRQVSAELLRDRRSARRWNLALRLGWFGLVLAIVWGLSTQRSGHPNAPTGPHTALVEVRGEIAVDAEANAEQLVSSIRTAFEDEGAKAVVLRINSPGGSPVQAGIIYDEIRRLKVKHKKKVLAVVEETCASGAYYIAVAADEIYVDKASLVGSIGVLMDGFGFTGLMDKLGVERRLVTAGSNKGMLDPFSPVDPKQTAYAKAMLDQIHQQFIKVVREGRGDRLKETSDTFSGLFWNGEEAVKLGLADHFGNLDYVAREVIGYEDVVDYTPQENVAERLAKRFGASIGEGAVRTLRNVAPLR